MIALLGISLQAWVLASAAAFFLGLAGLAVLIGKAIAAASVEQGYPVHPVRERAAADLDLWLAEDEIDWSELKVKRRVSSHTVDRGVS